ISMVEFGIEKSGQEHWLNDMGFAVTRATGLGADVEVSKSNNVTGTGYVTDSVNQAQREIDITVKIENPTSKKREELYSLFPVGEIVKMLIYNGSRTLYTNACVKRFEPDIFSNNQKVQIVLSAESPFFISVDTKKSEIITVTASSAVKAVVKNNGELCGFNLTAENTSSNAVINPYFRIGSKKLSFSITVPAGATVNLCTVNGKKSAQMTYTAGTSLTTVNVLPNRADGSEFPQLCARSVNSLYCGFESGTGSLEVRISYNETFNFV
ncbi:MAG: hypothetical protein UD936_06585, partial [Acutalibacteraceae bacterium]|nr:hypothetical protein [Acutalibacteraceae bacterium]